MEEMHKAKYGERMGRFHALSRQDTLQHLHTLTNWKLSDPHPLGCLWRLYCIGMSDDHW